MVRQVWREFVPARAALFAAMMVVLGILATPGTIVSAQDSTWEGLVWTRSPYNPVLVHGPPGSWDSLQVVLGSVAFDGALYRLWYWGSADGYVYAIGYATSAEGLIWTKDAANPVMTDADHPFVLSDSGGFSMWFMDHSTSYPSVGFATSTDGRRWSRYAGNPVLTLGSGWDSVNIAPGTVLHDGTGYRMWYWASGNGFDYSAGLASSPDGIHWTKYGGNPIIRPGGASWYSARVHPASVIPDGPTLVMWFVGSDLGVQRIGTATSLDGITWSMPSAPSLDVGPSGSWDGASLSVPNVVRDGDTLHMWYTGWNSGSWAVGVATAHVTSASPSSGFQTPLGVLPAFPFATLVAFAGAGIAAGSYRAISTAVRREDPRSPDPLRRAKGP